MNRPAHTQSLLPPLWVLGTAAIVGLFWVLYALKEMVVLLLIGYCIAYIIDPALDWLEKKKVSRTVGFFALCGLAAIVVALLFVTAYPVLSKEYSKLSDNLPSYVEQAKERIRPALSKARSYLPIKAHAPEGISQNDTIEVVSKAPAADILAWINGDSVKAILGGAVATLLQGYNLVLMAVNLALLPFIVFYLSVDFPQLHQLALAQLPVRRRRSVLRILKEIDRYVSAFVRGQLMVGAILSVLYMIGLKIVGLELWFLLGLISGFGNLVPYLGFLVGILLSSLMALVAFGDFGHLLQVFIVYGVVQALEGSVITPKVVGRSVGLSPLAVILAIFAGGSLFGLLGVFLAVPAAAVFRVLCKELHGWLLKRAELSNAQIE